VSRRLVGCRGEVRITKATAAAAHQQHMLLARDEIGDEIAAFCIKDCRAWRHPNDQVAPSFAVRRLVSAAARITCNVATFNLKVAQGRLPSIDCHIDAAATTTVAAIRATARHMRLATHR
jgi:hypothetical protein